MENHLQIQHIPISLGSKFQLQQTILIFVGEICPKKELFGQKKNELSIESVILELV